MEIFDPQLVAVPVTGVVSIAVAVIAAYKMVGSVRDMAQDNLKDIGYIKEEQHAHKDIHDKMEIKIEQLRRGEELIREDISSLKTDIASLGTKLDILLEHLKSNK